MRQGVESLAAAHAISLEFALAFSDLIRQTEIWCVRPLAVCVLATARTGGPHGRSCARRLDRGASTCQLRSWIARGAGRGPDAKFHCERLLMIGFTHLGLPRSSTPEVRLRFGFDNTPVSLCMLPSQPPQAVQQPAPAPPMALQPPPPRAAEPLMDDDDDKGKVSRWQIGSTSLSVLEQVYAMEPFPGAATLPGAAPARVGPREGCLGRALRRASRAAVATARRTAACSDTPRVNAAQSIPPCSLHFPRECRRP